MFRCVLFTTTVISLLGSILFSGEGYAQVRIKRPRFHTELASGYDSNILRISRFANNEALESQVLNIKGRMNWWLYWRKNMRSVVQARAAHTYLPQHTVANTWRIKFQVKNIFTVLRKTRNRSAIYWSVTGGYEKKNDYFSSRLLGEEYVVQLDSNPGEQLALGDLFDLDRFSLGSGLDIVLSTWVELEVAVLQEFENYKDLGTPLSPDFYSLDNYERSFLGSVRITPAKQFELKFVWARSDRDYEHKSARTLQGDVVNGLTRSDRYDKYNLSFSYNVSNFNGTVGYEFKHRQDAFAGYYNYSLGRVYLKSSFNINTSLAVGLSYKRTYKDYKNVTLGGNLLKNTYHTLKLELPVRLNSSLSLTPKYLYYKENSSYAPFTYDRHVMLASFNYRI